MAEKRKSSKKNNIGKKLALGLIAVISLPILLVGLAGIIIMHLVQNTALNAGVLLRRICRRQGTTCGRSRRRYRLYSRSR